MVETPTANGSVIREPDRALATAGPGISEYIMYYVNAANEIHDWGTAPMARDVQLRKFWRQEPYLMGAIFSTVARYASYSYTIHGPARQVARYQDMLQMSEHGKGWNHLWSKVLQDVFTQDNAGWAETVRLENNDTSPVVQMNHLDSSRCWRTGRAAEPIVYYDNHDIGHIMKYYQVMEITEFPSAVERMRGMQYCAVTRILRAAQIMRDINTYMYEKIGGRRHRAIHLVGGVGRQTIKDAMAQAGADADQEGLIRYADPIIINAVDPTADVKLATIELASLPDSFNEETRFRWYIAAMALAFGGDYQDYAPLPGGNLGTAQQSEVLDKKARGKGPSLFQSQVEQLFNFHGIMPRTCRFEFGDPYSEDNETKARASKLRAEEREARIRSGEINQAIARQLAVDAGDLPQDYLKFFAEQDLSPDVSGSSSFPLDQQ